jgi:hypothetical protein
MRRAGQLVVAVIVGMFVMWLLVVAAAPGGILHL